MIINYIKKITIKKRKDENNVNKNTLFESLWKTNITQLKKLLYSFTRYCNHISQDKLYSQINQILKPKILQLDKNIEI